MYRLPLDDWAMALAVLTSQRSTCRRRQVGAVFLNHRGHVIATGYNGNAAGLPHCLDIPCDGALSPSGTNLNGCEALHAEQNALLQCRDVFSIKSAYVTASPCFTCMKLLLNTSCEKIIFIDEYPHNSKDLWEKAGRQWIHYQKS
jgi:dCMP deaminase